MYILVKLNIEKFFVSLFICVVGIVFISSKTYCYKFTTDKVGFEFLNDAFFRKDNKISSSWDLYVHSNISSNKNTPMFPCPLRRFIALEKYSRTSIGIGQLIQTPDNLNRKDLIKDDVPYAGVLLFHYNLYTYSNIKLKGIQLVTGIVGPLALGEETQKFIHKKDPKGWTHQLHTEPILNINFLFKRKMLEKNMGSFCFDITMGVNGGIGNLFSQGGVILESRFGLNVPLGFLYHPDPVGFSPVYHTEFLGKNTHKTSIYLSLGVRGSGFLRNMLFDGNTFRKSHSIDKKSFVGQLLGGLHFQKNRFGIHFYVTITTDDVDLSKNYQGADNEKFGTILVEWKF